MRKPYDPEGYELPLREHFFELRGRLFRSLLALGLATAVSLGYSGRLLDFLLRPVAATYFFAPGEAFAAHLRVAFVAAWPLAWPVILYQAFAFASPGLYPHERRWLLWLLPAGTVLFAGGVAFGYLAMLPVVLAWLTRFASEGISPTLSVSTYTGFVVRSMVPFGLTFQLPLVVAVLARAGAVTARGLAAGRRWVVLGVFVLAALLTPPDVVSQVLMAVPMVLLFEVSVLIARFAGGRRRPSEGRSSPGSR